jgi:hypothetical protein
VTSHGRQSHFHTPPPPLFVLHGESLLKYRRMITTWRLTPAAVHSPYWAAGWCLLGPLFWAIGGGGRRGRQRHFHAPLYMVNKIKEKNNACTLRDSLQLVQRQTGRHEVTPPPMARRLPPVAAAARARHSRERVVGRRAALLLPLLRDHPGLPSPP